MRISAWRRDATSARRRIEYGGAHLRARHAADISNDKYHAAYASNVRGIYTANDGIHGDRQHDGETNTQKRHA